ncbi:MAG TPA: hypothetical protein VIR01_07825, partial [Pyrinomonadaceae bacterium]
MPKVRLRLFVAFSALILALLQSFSSTKAQRSGVDVYAITNARIVTVSGSVIDKGTVVVRNGLIASVGPDITAPPDARVIDATGLTVYPGLIDSYTN